MPGIFHGFPRNADSLKELADPVAFFSHLFARMPFGLAVWSADGRPLLANDSARALFDAAPPNVGAEPFARALGGETVQLPATSTPTGRRSVATTVFPLEGPDGRYVAASYRDARAEERSERRFRGFQESGVIGIVISSTSGNITEANDAFLEMVGYSRADLEVGLVSGKSLNTPERDRTDAAARRELAEKGVAHAWEKELLNKNGERIPVLMGVVLVDEITQESVAFVLDLTERKRAEAAVRESEALRREKEAAEAANSELEAFSYSVAHDLRAPLRAISGFSGIVLEENADRLDEDAKSLLRRSMASAERMGQLIDALLDLARLTRTPLNVEPVDLTQLARTVVDQLRAAEPDRVIEVDVAEGLTALADRELLSVLLVNLIGNAWKFTRAAKHPRIEVGSVTVSDETRYFVRDNGAGFDMKYANRLFGAFQRLHTTKQFEGTGIGLATVQRIVQRHGGRIWPEAVEQRGATFHFTLSGKRSR